MKNSLHSNPLLVKTIVLVTCFMLVMLYNKSKAADCSNKSCTVSSKVAVK